MYGDRLVINSNLMSIHNIILFNNILKRSDLNGENHFSKIYQIVNILLFNDYDTIDLNI